MVSSPKKYAPQLSRSTGPCVLLCESSGCATSRSSRIDCSGCCWVHRLSTMPAVHTPSHLPIAASTFRRPNEDNKLVNIIINLPFLLAAYLRVVSSSSPLIFDIALSNRLLSHVSSEAQLDLNGLAVYKRTFSFRYFYLAERLPLLSARVPIISSPRLMKQSVISSHSKDVQSIWCP